MLSKIIESIDCHGSSQWGPKDVFKRKTKQQLAQMIMNIGNMHNHEHKWTAGIKIFAERKRNWHEMPHSKFKINNKTKAHENCSFLHMHTHTMWSAQRNGQD